MEGVWILVGAALSLVSGIAFWFLNSRTTGQAQERQQQHDAMMQQQRLQHERQVKRDDVVRALRRERLQPVFEILRDVDIWLGYKIWQGATRETEEAGAVEKIAHELFGQDVPAETLRHVGERMRAVRAEPPEDLFVRTASVIFRLDDSQLLMEMSGLMKALSKGQEDVRWVASNIATIHSHLESYAARIDG